MVDLHEFQMKSSFVDHNEMLIRPDDIDHLQFDEMLSQLNDAEIRQLIRFSASKPLRLSQARELAIWATTATTGQERAKTFAHLLELLKENRWDVVSSSSSEYFH